MVKSLGAKIENKENLLNEIFAKTNLNKNNYSQDQIDLFLCYMEYFIEICENI